MAALCFAFLLLLLQYSLQRAVNTLVAVTNSLSFMIFMFRRYGAEVKARCRAARIQLERLVLPSFFLGFYFSVKLPHCCVELLQRNGFKIYLFVPFFDPLEKLFQSPRCAFFCAFWFASFDNIV